MMGGSQNGSSGLPLHRATQVPTPFTDALLGLSRLHARVRGLYPDA